MQESAQERTTWRIIVLLLGMAMCMALGCAKRDPHGDAAVYTVGAGTGILVSLGGLAAIAAGWLVRRRSWRLASLVTILGVALLGSLAPAAFLDWVKVDSNHFEGRYGFWMFPSRPKIEFDDLESIRVVVEEHSGRGSSSKRYRLDCTTKSGRIETVFADSIMKDALPEVLARALARGVRVMGSD